MTDSWARERADELLMSILLRSSRGQQRDALDAALREAEQRGAAIAKMEDEVAASPNVRTRLFSEFKADVNRYRQGRQAVLARLQNPDEAMIEAVKAAFLCEDWKWLDADRTTRAALTALAVFLSSPQEED
jgi:hypothetical protein